MNVRVILLIVLSATIFYKASEFTRGRKSSAILASVQRSQMGNEEYGIPNNCMDKKYCITVFVAPWCLACKSSEATFRMLNEYISKNRTEIGFGLVMGAGSAEQNEAEKTVLAPLEVTLDNSGEIFKNRGIKAFPTWIVNDKTGREKFNKAGGLNVTDMSQIPQLLTQQLKL